MDTFFITVALILAAVGFIVYELQRHHTAIAEKITTTAAAGQAEVAAVKAEVKAVRDAVTK
jgi:ubiquinone biosynthesis protein UbiJ